MDNIIELRNVSYNAGDREILTDFSLDVQKGHIHSILGTNGTGKSTLGYIIMGLDKYRKVTGDIIFKGENINSIGILDRAKLGITLAWQEPAVFEGLKIGDFLSVSGKGKDQVKAVLEKVGLNPSDYLNRQLDSTLSGGERKRIEMASVMLMEPELVILDEPDSGIDLVTIDSITGLIHEMKAKGSTILLITHREEISRQADNATLICNGRNMMTGKPDEVAGYFECKCRPCEHKNEPDDEIEKAEK